MGASWVGSSTPSTFAKRLADIAQRSENARPLTDAYGRRITVQSIPEAVHAGGRPTRFKPVLRHGMWAPTPLYDLGKMVNGIYYTADKTSATVFSSRTAPQSRLMHFGGTVHGRPFLVIPNVPPLTPHQARTMRPRDFPDGFWLKKGPMGPGFYRKMATGYSRSSHTGQGEAFQKKGIEKLFWLVRKVTTPARPWFLSQVSDRTWVLEMSGGFIVWGAR